MLDDQAIATAAPAEEEDLFRVDFQGRVLLTVDQMVAALGEYAPDEITPEMLPEVIGTAIMTRGWWELQQVAEEIAADEKAGKTREWLPLYRRMVREFAARPVSLAVVA